MALEGCCKTDTAEKAGNGSPEVVNGESTRGTGKYFRPAVDIIEKTDELVVIADIPGTSSEEIEVKFEKGVLSVLAPVKERAPKNGKVLHREYEVGGYYRSFQIGEGIDPAKISAEYVDGVLTLSLPKSEQSKTRKIPVH